MNNHVILCLMLCFVAYALFYVLSMRVSYIEGKISGIESIVKTLLEEGGDDNVDSGDTDKSEE